MEISMVLKINTFWIEFEISYYFIIIKNVYIYVLIIKLNKQKEKENNIKVDNRLYEMRSLKDFFFPSRMYKT